MKIVFFVEQEDTRGRTARDQPVLAAGDSLGREMLERSSQVPRNTLALPHSLTGWGRTRRAVPARLESWVCSRVVYGLHAPRVDDLVGAGPSSEE